MRDEKKKESQNRQRRALRDRKRDKMKKGRMRLQGLVNSVYAV